jgi:hypothetical protein
MDTETVTPLIVDLSNDDDLAFTCNGGFGAVAALGISPAEGDYSKAEDISILERRLAAAGHSYAWARLSEDTTPAGKIVRKHYKRSEDCSGWDAPAPDDSGDWSLVAVLHLGEKSEDGSHMRGVDALALWLKPPSAAFGSEAHAEAFMVGDLMTAAKLRFMDLAVPWSQLTEEEQGRLLLGLGDDVRRAAKKAIRIIAHHGRVEFRAQVDQVNFKGDDEVKAVLKMLNSSEAHGLADVAGGYVTVIIEQNDELLAIPEAMTKGEPDQRPLFDVSTEPTTV